MLLNCIQIANVLSAVTPRKCLMTDELRALYEEYVEYFDPTPQYLYDEPYRLLEFEEWYEDIYLDDFRCTPITP